MGRKLILVLFWTIAIAVLSLMPNPEISQISWTDGIQIDKLAHIFLYMMYSILLGRYLAGGNMPKVKQSLVILAVPIAFGILMEFMQYYLSPSRFFDMLDIIANIIGSIVGLLILKIKF